MEVPKCCDEALPYTIVLHSGVYDIHYLRRQLPSKLSEISRMDCHPSEDMGKVLLRGKDTVAHGQMFWYVYQVFVSNLAFEVAWQDLKDHMRQAGNVLRADIFIGYDGRSKGFGIVEYSKPFEV